MALLRPNLVTLCALAVSLSACQLVTGVDDLVITGSTGNGGGGSGPGPGTGGSTSSQGGGGGAGGMDIPCEEGPGNPGILCGQECILDAETNTNHCGGCDNQCGMGESCALGRCNDTVLLVGYTDPLALAAAGDTVYSPAHASGAPAGESELATCSGACPSTTPVESGLANPRELGALAGVVAVAETNAPGRLLVCPGNNCTTTISSSPGIVASAGDLENSLIWYTTATEIVGVHSPLDQTVAVSYTGASSASVATVFDSVTDMVLVPAGDLGGPSGGYPDAVVVSGEKGGAGKIAVCALDHTGDSTDCSDVLLVEAPAGLAYRHATGSQPTFYYGDQSSGELWRASLMLSSQMIASGQTMIQHLILDRGPDADKDALFWIADGELRGCLAAANPCTPTTFLGGIGNPVAIAATASRVYVLERGSGSAAVLRYVER